MELQKKIENLLETTKEKGEETGLTIYDFLKNIKIKHICFLFVTLIIVLIILNNVFKFSHNYRINQKISQIAKIQEIKSKYRAVDLLDVENEIYNNNTVFSEKNMYYVINRGKSFIPNFEPSVIEIENQKNIIDNKKHYLDKKFITYFLSVQFIWIFIIFVSIFLIATRQNRKTGIQMIIVSIVIGIFWYFLFIFLNGLFGTKNIWWNVLYNFLLFAIIGSIGKNTEENNQVNHDKK